MGRIVRFRERKKNLKFLLTIGEGKKTASSIDVTNFLKPYLIEVIPWAYLLGKPFLENFSWYFEIYLGLSYLIHQFLFLQSVDFSQKQTDKMVAEFSPLLSPATHILDRVICNGL